MTIAIADLKILVDGDIITITKKSLDVFNNCYFSTLYSVDTQNMNGPIDDIISKLINYIQNPPK